MKEPITIRGLEMNIARQIGTWGIGRTAANHLEDIQNEFEFHLDCLTKELVEQGWDSASARHEAERRFGNRSQIEQQCRQIYQGPLTWFLPLTLFSFLAGTCALVWMFLSLRELQSQNKALLNLIERLGLSSAFPGEISDSNSLAEPTQDPLLNLKGKVTDEKGKPIKGAKVLLVHKSWPNQKYTQESHATETGEDGTYEFEDLYSTSHQNAFLQTVLADGFEMLSEYEMVKAKKKGKVAHFRLKSVTPIKFTFLDDAGSPLTETDVVLLSRKAGTKEHMIFEMCADDAKVTTDDQGSVSLAYLREKDVAKFGIFVFDELRYVELTITDEENQTVKQKKKN